MAHHAKKVGGEVDLFAKIRDKIVNAAKGEGQSQAPNLAGPVVEPTGLLLRKGRLLRK